MRNWAVPLNPSIPDMKHILIFVFLGLFVARAAQDKTEGHILWNEEYRLTWDDFQGKARKSHVASAMSDITFAVKIKSEGSTLTMYIQPSFNPKGSWVKDEDKSDYLLKHEQIHFDIAELNARKLREELQTKKLTKVNAESSINRLVERYSEQNVKMQDRYDNETEHSLKTEKQEKWNADVEAEIKSLDAYKEASFEVKLQ